MSHKMIYRLLSVTDYDRSIIRYLEYDLTSVRGESWLIRFSLITTHINLVYAMFNTDTHGG